MTAMVIELPRPQQSREDRTPGPLDCDSALERLQISLRLADGQLTIDQGLSIGLHVAIFRLGDVELYRFGWCEDEAIDRLREDLDVRIGTRPPAHAGP